MPLTARSTSEAPTQGAGDALERSLTQVARAILRMSVPSSALTEGERIDRSQYWALVRLGEAPSALRLSDLASALELDLSTVSRQVKQMSDTGLVTREADPDDGRACLVGLSDKGRAVLESVRSARTEVLRNTMAGWNERQRAALAAGIERLALDLQALSR